MMAAEYATATDTPNCVTCYMSADHLGTARLITDQGGNVVSRHDYMPFGEEFSANQDGRNGQWGTGNDSINQKFTAKERDSESGLDYFGARYYGSALGRFTSPDPENASAFLYPDDPQSWNGYAYGRNNPLSYIDPDGLSYQICDANGKNCAKQQLTDDEFAKEKHSGQGNGEVFNGNGTFSHTDSNGNNVVDGTYRQTDVDLPGDAATNRAAAGAIVSNFNQAMTDFGKNAAYAVTGTFVLRGIGVAAEAATELGVFKNTKWSSTGLITSRRFEPVTYPSQEAQQKLHLQSKELSRLGTTLSKLEG